MFDCVAVDLKTKRVRIMGNGLTEENAEAVRNMAVMRRGVDREFFAVTAANSYTEGMEWRGAIDR